jgi:hypothetical protein
MARCGKVPNFLYVCAVFSTKKIFLQKKIINFDKKYLKRIKNQDKDIILKHN